MRRSGTSGTGVLGGVHGLPGEDSRVTFRIDVVAAIALVAAVGQYGPRALLGLPLWLLVRGIRQRWPWGWLSLAALVLSFDSRPGVAELGGSRTVLEVGLVLAVIWVHATGYGPALWVGLGVLLTVDLEMDLVGPWLAAPVDPIAVGKVALALIGPALLFGGVAWVSRVLAARWGRRGGPGTTSPVETWRSGDLERVPTWGGTWREQDAIAVRQAVGQAGEERVRALLADGLPVGTWVLSNLELPGLGGDIDLLVIGSTGVFLPEVKTWSGAIACGADGHTWRRLRAGCWEKLLDPVAQTQRELRALRRYLERKNPELCRRTRLWIEPLLVFAHPNSRVDGGSSPIPVVSPDGAVETIRTAVPRRPLEAADQEELVALVAVAQPVGGRARWLRAGMPDGVAVR